MAQLPGDCSERFVNTSLSCRESAIAGFVFLCQKPADKLSYDPLIRADRNQFQVGQPFPTVQGDAGKHFQLR
jgi:hypothetical protein